MTNLTAKKIVVVGGSSGIGFGVAAAALENGAEVTIAGRSADKLEAAKKRLGGAGSVRSIAADMADETAVARLFDEAGAFDHLVATAGTPPPNYPIGETDMGFVRGFLDSKFTGAVMLAKHAVRTLNRGGSMIFTSGVNKDRPPVPGGSVVAAVAGSFSYFARALALELAPTRVNIVSPGWVDTEMWDEIVGAAKSGYFDQMAARLPAGRVAKPADIAAAYLYLMQNDFVTGETIHIDGGQRLV